MLDQQENPDWHPGTDSMVQDLVHPSLYPLVYGKTRVFHDEVVGVDDAVDAWAGRGEVIPGFGPPDPLPRYQERISFGGDTIDPSFWSTTYQWLPSNISLRPDGSVKFTSYINNLHPTKYREIYATVERLIEQVIPAWDICLTRYQDYKKRSGGRVTPRFPPPKNAE